MLSKEIRESIGKEFKPVTCEVEKGAIRRIAQAVGDSNPLWQDEEYAQRSIYGGIIAPPTFLTTLRDEEWREWALTVEHPLKRGLLVGNELEFLQPIRPGDRITVATKLAEAFERPGKTGDRLFLIFETIYTNQHNEVVAKVRQTWVRR
jgi:acyl dehydratase